jgi:hypothetical protein
MNLHHLLLPGSIFEAWCESKSSRDFGQLHSQNPAVLINLLKTKGFLGKWTPKILCGHEKPRDF